METLNIIKISGNIIDDESRLLDFLKRFALIEGKKILIHGGGKLAGNLAEKLGIKQQMVEGRRITDAATLEIITMVYAGLINKNITASLQARGCNALGLTGADADLIPAVKRPVSKDIDYGFVGDVQQEAIPVATWNFFLDQGFIPVVAPVTHDRKGQLLNTNADTIAREIAVALSQEYEVTLTYLFEKSGVLTQTDDDSSIIPHLNFQHFEALKAGKIIYEGMIPKLDNAFSAIKKGVHKVKIGKAEDVVFLINGIAGTSITYE